MAKPNSFFLHHALAVANLIYQNLTNYTGPANAIQAAQALEGQP